VIPRLSREAVLERCHGRCEAGTPACTGRVDHMHHRRLRSQGGTHDPANLLAVCQPCHDHIHHRPAEAYERGWLERGVR
jgi:5-methylcytosine-specific restriction endonuclease McrA